jgi:predicted DNA-binding transcriptional regulator AlpA
MPNLIRAKQVARKRGRSVAQLYADINAGAFPPGYRLSPKVVVWKESDVDQHIENELNQAEIAGGI